jgi:hypothetical protein
MCYQELLLSVIDTRVQIPQFYPMNLRKAISDILRKVCEIAVYPVSFFISNLFGVDTYTRAYSIEYTSRFSPQFRE